jgi:hypothetical protein
VKYDIVLKNQTNISIDFLLFSNETKKEFKNKILNNSEKIISYEKEGFVGFTEMSLFTKGILIKKIEVYGGNIINIIKKNSKIHVEISYPDF